MFTRLRGEGAWSDVGLRLLTVSVVMCILLSVLDGVIRGPLQGDLVSNPLVRMVGCWVVDFRYLFEQGLYASTVFFVGAKFFETRTIMTIGFDRADGSKISLKGPDDENVVWIGRRYGSPAEAQAVASAIAGRIEVDGKTG